MNGLVFDTGALIALDRGDRAMLVFVAEVRRERARVTVPAGCVAQAWRDPPRQARLAGFLRLPEVRIVPLDDADARAVGLLCRRTRRSDVVDAHVVVCALRAGDVVLTSDPGDLHALAPQLRLHRV